MIVIDLSREIALTLAALIILILVNALLGIVRAIADGTFDMRELPRFARTHILPDVGALVILAAASIVVGEIKAIFYATAAAQVLRYLAKIKDKLVLSD